MGGMHDMARQAHGSVHVEMLGVAQRDLVHGFSCGDLLCDPARGILQCTCTHSSDRHISSVAGPRGHVRQETAIMSGLKPSLVGVDTGDYVDDIMGYGLYQHRWRRAGPTGEEDDVH